MKTRLITSAALILVSLLAACTAPHTDLKSPCAGIDGSPCGPRHPVNDWWLKDRQQEDNG